MTRQKRTCSIEGCTKAHYGRGWCVMHWTRWWRYGSPLEASIIVGDDAARIESKINRELRAPCWAWTGKPSSDGYCRVKINGGNRYAHVVLYEQRNGPVPAGMTLDHECHNEAAARGECAGGPSCLHRSCVNPAHLVAKPIGDNALASPHTINAINAAKTHCKHGHEFTPENIYIERRNGEDYRRCRQCGRDRGREYMRAKRDRKKRQRS